jgi:Ran GTPase-activating protein (RanGAP) involved in mRNA processing and transport
MTTENTLYPNFSLIDHIAISIERGLDIVAAQLINSNDIDYTQALSNRENKSLLNLAAEKNMAYVAYTLILKGGDVNHAGNDGLTAFHWAVSWSNQLFVEVLMQYGANPDTSVLNHKTALKIAQQNHFVEIERAIVDYSQLFNALKNSPRYFSELKYQFQYFSIARFIANSLITNTVLTDLDIDHRDGGGRGKLKFEEIDALARVLQYNRSLTSLSLAWQDLKDDSIIALSNMLLLNTTLSTLYINTCQVTDIGASHLANALTKNTALKNLQIGNNCITNIGVKLICEMLLKNNTLTDMGIGDNDFNVEGTRHLISVLKNNTSITRLDLSHSNLEESEYFDNDVIKEFTALLSHQSTLKYLNISSNNNLGEIGAKYFSDVFASNTTLTGLNLSYCGIKTEGFASVANKLKYNTTLQTIKLGGEDAGINCQILIEVLKTNKSITSIDLSENDINAEIAEGLANMLKMNNTIKTFHLGDNPITNTGAKHIGKMLEINKTLESLNLRFIGIDLEGFEILIEALMFNTTLVELIADFTHKHDEDNEKYEASNKKQEKLLLRNQLLLKYPQFACFIKEACAKAGLYKPNIYSTEQEAISLKNLTGLFIYYNKTPLVNIPDEIKKFVEDIKEFDQGLDKIISPEDKTKALTENFNCKMG